MRRKREPASGGGDGDGEADAEPDFFGDEAGGAKGKASKPKSGGFESMGLLPPLFNALRRKGYRLPTPVQRKAIPLILAGNDVVAMARTGSGKTAAFLLPLLHRLRCHSPVSGARGLVLSPTRELALQTLRFARDMAHFTDLRMCCLVGGDALDAQFEALAAAPDVLVATPGRLLHHLAEVAGMSLRTVEVAVLDEADRLFEMGFAEQIRDIFNGLSEARQTLLFSATLPHQLADFAAAGLRAPVVVRMDAASTLPETLCLSFFACRPAEKLAALLYLLREYMRLGTRALVFVSTRHHVELLVALLRADGVECGGVYGAMDQTARKAAVARFRSGSAPVLVVTDIAARGIDIPLLDAAINYDFPPTGTPALTASKLFVHRVGRVARAGAAGEALSLVTRDDLGYLLDLQLFLGRPLRLAPGAGEVTAATQPDELLLGCLPPASLESAVERARILTENNDNVRALLRVSVNAAKQYCKTRPAASAESVRRGRELLVPGVHPALLELGPGAGADGRAQEAALAGFSARIGAYRPSATVMEAQVAAMRPLSAPGSGAHGEIMKAKRAAHSGAIAAHKSEARVAPDTTGMVTRNAPLACGRFRDPSFFLDMTPKPAHLVERTMALQSEGQGARALADSVLDLVADDAEGAAMTRALVKWDSRKRRYISLHGGDAEAARRGNKRLRTESGALIKGRNSGNPEENGTGLYKRWQEKTKQHVAPSGIQVDAPASDSSRGRGRGRGRGRMVNSQAREELRSIPQIRKQRTLEARSAERERGRGDRGRGEGGGRGRGRSAGRGRSPGRGRGRGRK